MGIDRGFNFATNRLEFHFKKTHDRATIAPRLGHDRGLIVIAVNLGHRLRVVESIPR